MPSHSHEKLRELCCCLCYNERGIKPKRLLSATQADVISFRLLPTFSLSDFNSPIGICPGCHTALDKLKHGKVDSIYTSEQFGTAKVSRKDLKEGKCSCLICERASLNGPAWKLFVKEWNEKRNGSVKKKTKSDEFPLCPICLSEVKFRSISSHFPLLTYF